MNVWKRLFITGEFAAHSHILGGLTLERVGAEPRTASTRDYGTPPSGSVSCWTATKLLLSAGKAAVSFLLLLDRKRNALEVLTLHSAYHMGRIVSLRQVMGVWGGASTGALSGGNG